MIHDFLAIQIRLVWTLYGHGWFIVKDCDTEVVKCVWASG